MLPAGTVNLDRAYLVLQNVLTVGLKGLSFAAMTAAVVMSLAGKAIVSLLFLRWIFTKQNWTLMPMKKN